VGLDACTLKAAVHDVNWKEKSVLVAYGKIFSGVWLISSTLHLVLIFCSSRVYRRSDSVIDEVMRSISIRYNVC